MAPPGRALLIAAVAAWLPTLSPAVVAAQAPIPSSTTEAAPAGAARQVLDEEDDPAELDLAEPDFVVVNLPTTLRLPRFKSNFRITHRFAGNLANRSFSESAADLFGMDQGAIIGFEYRINLMRSLQVAAFRTNFDKTFMFYGKYDGLRQRARVPVSVSAIVSVEGTNNFQEEYAPGVGVVVSRKLWDRIALYAAPMWVDHTNASLEPIGHSHDHGGEVEEHEHADEPAHERRSTTFVGLGARVRLTRTVYVVGEVTPRVDGYAPDKVEYGFGLEKRVGGHAFSLTFTNTFGTTFAQMARGGTANSLYLGFNLGRKFF